VIGTPASIAARCEKVLQLFQQRIGRWWRRLTSGTTNRSIFGAAVTVGGATGLVSLIAMSRELIVAAEFGTGDDLDAFLVAIVLPMFVINAIGGSFAAALIPTFIRVREHEGKDQAQHVFSSVMILGALFLMTASLLLALANSLLLPVLTSGFDQDKFLLTQQLFLLFVPAVFFGGMASMWSAMLNAEERFAMAALSQALIPLAAILALFAARGSGIYALTAGIAGGYAARFCVVGWALNREGVSLWPRWNGLSPEVRHVVAQYLPMAAGSAILGTTVLVDRAFAAALAPGSVATLDFGAKVGLLITGLGAAALGTAVLPHFSRMVANAEWDQVRHTIRTFSSMIVLASIPIVGILLVFSRPIVEIIFQRGAFTESDVSQVAWVQSLYSLQIPFFGMGILLARLLSSLGANHFLLWQASICLAINMVLSFVLSRAIGVAGISLSTSLMYVAAFCILSFMASRRLGDAERGRCRSSELTRRTLC